MLVVSRHRLVRDAVGTALSSLGFLATPVGLPLGTDQVHRLRRRVARAGPATGLVVTDLHDVGRLRDAAALTVRVQLPWVVLTGAVTEAAHETLHRCGVHTVLSASTGLGELREVLLVAASRPGRHTTPPPRASPGEEVALAMRLITLSSSEMEILQELDRGHPVKAIAQRRGVTVGTVRGQVKSLLHKLGVSSQLQAVAIYRRINLWFAD